MRISVDVVEAMKTIAPQRGFAGYQTLLKAFLSERLRRDDARFAATPHSRLVQCRC